MRMVATIIMVGEDIHLVPAIDGWTLDDKQIDIYPRIGDFIALATIKIFDLPGGFCLVENGKILVEPQCCADFSDVGRWETLADFKAPEWLTRSVVVLTLLGAIGGLVTG
jgi:hypothetical protein